MRKYTVKDTVSGRNVTFTWEGENEPTDEDMTQIFAESRKITGKTGTKDWMPESHGGIPKWGLENPAAWGLRGAGLEVYKHGVQPTLEALGMVGGSFGSPVVGTSLGYSAGKKAGEIGEGYLSRLGMPEELQKPERTVGQEFLKSAVDVSQPLVMGGAFKGASKLIQPIDDKITQVVKKGIEKGVRPTVVGKRTYTQQKIYSERSEQAVKAIVKNKENLNLSDEFGDAVKGLPKNLNQFSQAIEQTKKRIYDQYNRLAEISGEKGILINLGDIRKELLSFANKKRVQLISPKMAKYARDYSDRLMEANPKTTEIFSGVTTRVRIPKSVTPKQAQDMIADLNNSLQAFYKNPSYSHAKKAYVDQMVVNNLRKALDKKIMDSTGKQYQALKNEYGALKSIEREVNHRAVVDARKNQKGLIDFSDVFTGYHAAKGILTMDPATIGAAGTGKFVAWLYRLKNQPNRQVGNMFKDVDRLMKKQPSESVQKIGNKPRTVATSTQKPTITGAAIKLKPHKGYRDGRIFTGKTHHLAMDEFDKAGYSIKDWKRLVGDADGFVTSKGRFVTRKQANKMVGNKPDEIDAAEIVGKPFKYKRVPTTKKGPEIMPKGKFTDMGKVKKRVPTTKKGPKRYIEVIEHGTGKKKKIYIE